MQQIVYSPNSLYSGHNHLRLNPQIIERIHLYGLIREFAAFLKLKNKCVNSRVYNYTGSHIASILGVSRQTADRYLKVFLKQGWVYYSGDILNLEKIKELSKQYTLDDPKSFSRESNVYLKIKGVPLKELIIKLKYLIIKQKELNKNFLLELSRNLSNVKDSKQYCKLLRKAKKYKLNVDKSKNNGEIDHRLQISFKGLSELLDCSVGSAYNLMKKMTSRELLRKYVRREVLLKNVPSGAWESLLQYKAEYKKCFYCHGNIIRNHSNKYAMIL